jgi:hypothetical protein
MRFAKIVEVDGEQVLFYLEPDADEDDKEKLNQIVRIDGMCINTALCGMSYKAADAAFAKIDDACARRLLKVARSMIKGA